MCVCDVLLLRHVGKGCFPPRARSRKIQKFKETLLGVIISENLLGEL